MTAKMTISVPDDVAEYLRSTGNASAEVVTAVRPRQTDARRRRQREGALALAEHLNNSSPEQIAEDQALIEMSNNAVFTPDTAW
jgi:hypothetical protein